ncbi:SMI1/KNR4 family protein [Ruminococcus flavefaciens]|uniref:SMI1 / KNR4 family (SUKH-1) n=1 Tax=Ruminococcus flavefaciens TaxID=1265 RepID=A0A1M7KWC3_RUMFL|nr:SMI1/KNR4 family protein [Ruminococcus flavefaciens]SHM69888.1 SMI1 / KNR4 family (SUKH-1) [Ruminococcus flavefaciens]
MSAVTEVFSRIIELSKQLHEKADWWFYEINEPVSRVEISKHEYENDIVLPEAFRECLTVSNGFMVDHCSTVGYLELDKLTCARHVTSKRQCIGWIRGCCLYYDHQNGDFFIERERYKYDLINDFCQEVLIPAEEYLKKQLSASERKYELLEKQKDNPYREYYDIVVSFMNKGNEANIDPPVSEEEIAEWEKTNNILLPESYKNWLLLANGMFFDGWDLYSLDEVAEKADTWYEEYEGEKYVFLASLTGCCDFLIGSVTTGKALELSEEYEISDGEDSLEYNLDFKIDSYRERFDISD